MVTARLAGDARMSADTVSRYVGLLELVGFVVRVTAWTPTLTSREKRHPKVMIADTGLACGLLGRNVDGLGTPTSPLTGPLLDSSLAGPQRRRGRSDRRRRQRQHRRRRSEGIIDRVAGRCEAPPRAQRQARRSVCRRRGALPRRPSGSARQAHLGSPRVDALVRLNRVSGSTSRFLHMIRQIVSSSAGRSSAKVWHIVRLPAMVSR